MLGRFLGGGSPLLRPLHLEPLEERRMLAVHLTSSGIEAGDGLSGHSDTIPRLSYYDVHVSPHATTGPTFDNDVFTPSTNGYWKTPTGGTSIWKINGVATTDSPTVNSFVIIPTGYTVTYNVAPDDALEIFAVEVAGTLTFQSDMNTKLRVGTLYVLPDDDSITTNYMPGELNVEPDSSHTAEIAFTDYDWGVGAAGTTGYKLKESIDTHHFTGGLIAYGRVNINGTGRFESNVSGTHDVLLDEDDDDYAGRAPGELQKIGTWSEITSIVTNAGQSVITLDKRVDDWKEGDTIVIPDTRRGVPENAADWTDVVQIPTGGISHPTTGPTAGQTVITLNTTVHAHAGYESTLTGRDNNTVQFKAIAGLLTHNVKIYSETPVDTAVGATDLNRPRGHTIFGGNAEVHVTFAELRDLGRTDATQSVFIDPDFLTPADPNPLNQTGRYAVHLHHLVGPLGTSQEIAAMEPEWLQKYAFVFDGNSIVNSKKWAMALHDSSFGDVRGNVIFNAQGAGIVTEDGSEIDNRIYHNLVVKMTGNGTVGWDDGQGGIFRGEGNWVERQENSDLARGGSGFWFRRSGNDVVGNMAMGIAYAGYVYSSYNLIDTVNVPAARGLDKSVEGNYETLLENRPGRFVDNTTLGKSLHGAWFAYISGNNLSPDDEATEDIGDYGYETPVFEALRFRAFNVTSSGVIAYHVTNLKFTDLAVVSDHTQWTHYFSEGGTGFNTVAAYENINTMFEGGIIENMGTGMVSALGDASEPWVHQVDNEWRYETRYLDVGLLDGAVAGGTTVRDMKFKNWINFVMYTAAPRGFDHNTVLLDAVELHPSIFGGTLLAQPQMLPYRIVQSLDDPNDSELTTFDNIERQNIFMNLNGGTDSQLLSTTSLLVKNGLKIFEFDGEEEVEIEDGLDDDHQIYFGEQAEDFLLPQGDALSLTSVTPHVVGQPGYRTEASSAALDNDALWEQYGLSAAGEVLPPSAVLSDPDYRFVSDLTGAGSIRPYVGPLPAYRVLPGEGELAEDNPRLSLVTPWDGAQLIVPVDKTDVQLWIRAQVNGGLKTNSSGDAIEQVLITLTDLADLTHPHEFDAGASQFRNVLPWHRYRVDVRIENASSTTVATRSATFSVVQPNITGVTFSYVDTGDPTHVNAIQLGINPDHTSSQLRSISDTVNRVSVHFQRPMDVSGATPAIAGALKLIKIGASQTAISGTNFSWDSINNIATWTVADASGLAAGQYFVQLPATLVDASSIHHSLTNGWYNPRGLKAVHPGVSAVALDGSIGDDFNLAVTILPGDVDHDNKLTGPDVNLQKWPLAHVWAVALSDGDTTFGIGLGTGQWDPVTLPSANRILIRFDQPMSQVGLHALGQNALSLVPELGSPTTSIPLLANSYVWDRATNTATWTLDVTADDIVAFVHVRLVEGLADHLGRALDGEWTDQSSTISGNDTAGGEFDFGLLFLLFGDANDDHIVDFTDLGILLNHYNQSGTWATGDFNGDGVVNFYDLGILLNNYGRSV